MQNWDRRPKALQILGRAVESIRQILISTPLLLPGAIVATALIDIGLVHLSNYLPVSVAQELELRRLSGAQLHSMAYTNLLPLLLLHLAARLPISVITAIPCIIICRQILLEEASFRWPPLSILLRYAAWNFVLGALVIISSQLQYFFFGPWETFLVFTIASLLTSILVALVFPGIAIGVHYHSVWDRVRSGLRHLRGNFWLMFRAYLTLVIAAIAAAYLLYLPGLLFFNNPLAIAPTSWIAVSYQAMIVVITSCIAAGTVAWLYAWVAPPQFLENFD